MSIEPGTTTPPPAPQYPAPTSVQRFPEQQRVGPAAPIPVKVTNAFSVGFYAFWGAFVASIVIWILAFVVLAACGGIIASSIRSNQ